ncbi:MAG TPA: hypothetical protein VNW99_04075 [Cytophagaceae bacterium]|jgi:hypothetical protein|nr:hypothetical protein [Cytophagaceae bacterium]
MRHLVILTLLFIYSLSFGQKIKVSESQESIEKIPRTGLSTIIELDDNEVESDWKKQLKNYGKVDYSKGVYTVAIANVPSISSSPCRITSIVKSSGKGTQVWYSIDLGSTHVTSSGNSSAYKAAEKILNDFAILCYKDDINSQIKDAEKALSNSVKAQEKEVNQGQNLLKDVEKNKQDKLNLEQKIKENGEQAVQLQKDIAKNKTDQAAAGQDVEKMKKALEVVKAKLTAVGQ